MAQTYNFAVTGPTYTPSTSPPGHNPDAELIGWVEQAIATWHALGEVVSDAVEIPPEIEAEQRRLAALVNAHVERAVVLPALTWAGLCAKAELVRLLHGLDLALAAECIEQRARRPDRGTMLMPGEPAPAAPTKRRHREVPPSLGGGNVGDQASGILVATQAEYHEHVSSIGIHIMESRGKSPRSRGEVARRG